MKSCSKWIGRPDPPRAEHCGEVAVAHIIPWPGADGVWDWYACPTHLRAVIESRLAAGNPVVLRSPLCIEFLTVGADETTCGTLKNKDVDEDDLGHEV